MVAAAVGAVVIGAGVGAWAGHRPAPDARGPLDGEDVVAACPGHFDGLDPDMARMLAPSTSVRFATSEYTAGSPDPGRAFTLRYSCSAAASAPRAGVRWSAGGTDTTTATAYEAAFARKAGVDPSAGRRERLPAWTGVAPVGTVVPGDTALVWSTAAVGYFSCRYGKDTVRHFAFSVELTGAATGGRDRLGELAAGIGSHLKDGAQCRG